MSESDRSQALDPAALRRLLADAQIGETEVALVDVREEGVFGEGHALLAVNTPYGRLEPEVAARVPRRAARVVVIGHDDDGDRLARLAARRLLAIGFEQVDWLAGGSAAWAAAGEPLFQGVNVPSKAFAECVEHAFHTPSITAQELVRRREAGERIVVLDSRTAQEHARFHVPGAVSCPSAELLLHFEDLVPADTSLVVVSCAGRTRGIIGAQALLNAGVDRPLAALEGGTQGWRLAGLATEGGPLETLPPATTATLAAATARAAQLTRRFGVPHIDHATLARWRGDRARTTYGFDVRTEAEYLAGHVPGFRAVAGGQLVQTLDQWAATRGARIVLSDDAPGVRATVTAHWLRQLGWDASVLDASHEGIPLAHGAAPDEGLPAGIAAPLSIDVEEGARRLAGGALGLALGASDEHRRTHVPGTRWVDRERLAAAVIAGRGRSVLLFASDPQRAALAAIDLQELADAGALPAGYAVVKGGVEAWRASGRALASSPDEPVDAERSDMLFWLHDRHDGNAAASRAYLAWEADLPRQVGWPERSPFVIGPLAPA